MSYCAGLEISMPREKDTVSIVGVPDSSAANQFRLSPATRRKMLVPILVSLVVSLAAVFLYPWPLEHRRVMIVCALVGWICVALEYLVPWDRVSLGLYTLVPAIGLLDIGVAMWVSGGWNSPFTPFLVLPVTYAVMCTNLRYALPVAAVAGLVTASPGLYGHGGSFGLIALAAVPAYTMLVIMIDVIVRHLRSSDRLIALEVEARRQSEARAQDLMALQRVFAIVARFLSMDEAIHAIVEELASTFGHSLISIYLLDEGKLRMQAQRGYTNYFEVFDVGQGVIGTCCERDETIFVRDAATSDLYLEAAEHVVSEIAIPLHDEGQVAGVLNIESLEPLGDRDRDLLELFAAQVSVVLRNARLAGELRERANRDPLTGLLNHRSLFTVLEDALAQNETCSVLVADLDIFKQINDRFGHMAGDEVLRYVAELLAQNCRQGDYISRYGGDEFVVVLPGVSADEAGHIADRIFQAVDVEPYLYRDGVQIPVSLSLGLATFPMDGSTPQSIVDAADRQMYRAKRVHVRS